MIGSITYGEADSFLLELLRFAGWKLQVRRGDSTTILATRDDVEVEATERTLRGAAGVVFARAMRSARSE